MTVKSVKWPSTTDTSVISNVTSGISSGAGADKHLMIGRWTASGVTRIARALIACAMNVPTDARKHVNTDICVRTNYPGSHMAWGGSPQGVGYLLTGSFTEGTGGSSETVWTTDGTHWDNQPGAGSAGATKNIPTSDNTLVRIDATNAVDARLPATVKRADTGAAGPGGTWYGVEVRSSDEASTTRSFELRSDEFSTGTTDDPYLEFFYDDNQDPLTPKSLKVNAGQSNKSGAAVIASSSDGKSVTLSVSLNDPDLKDTERPGTSTDYIKQAQFQLYDDTAVTGSLGTVRYDSGAIDVSGGSGGFGILAAGATTQYVRDYSRTITGLTRGKTYRGRVRLMDKGGVWSPWTKVDTGEFYRFTMNTTSSAPGNRAVDVDTTNPHITGSIVDLDPGATLNGVEMQVIEDRPAGPYYKLNASTETGGTGALTGSWTGGTTYDITYSSTSGEDLEYGVTYRRRERTVDNTGTVGTWSTWLSWTPKLWLGPTNMQPRTTATKLPMKASIPLLIEHSSAFTTYDYAIANDQDMKSVLSSVTGGSAGSTTLSSPTTNGGTTAVLTSASNFGVGDTIAVSTDTLRTIVAIAGTTITVDKAWTAAWAATTPVQTFGKLVTVAGPFAYGQELWWTARAGNSANSDAVPIIIDAQPLTPIVYLDNGDGTTTRIPMTTDTTRLVAPTLTPLIVTPFEDDDETGYLEYPVSGEFEIRKDSDGTLIEDRVQMTGATYLLTDEKAADTVLHVASTSNVKVGQDVYIGTGAARESFRITAVGTSGANGTGITISGGLAARHYAGESVRVTQAFALVPESQQIGERLDPMDSTSVALWTGSNATPGSVAAAPSAAYTTANANSLNLPTVAVNGANVLLASRAFAARTLDFSGGAILKFWARISSITSVTNLRLRLIFNGNTVNALNYDFAVGAGGAITVSNTWTLLTVALGAWSSVGTGTPDLSNLTRWDISLSTSASVSPAVALRDLRIGSIQTAESPATGDPALETSVQMRRRYKDPNSAGDWSPWSNGGTYSLLKLSAPPTLAAGTAPDPLDGTPVLTAVYTSPGGKATSRMRASVYRYDPVTGGGSTTLAAATIVGATNLKVVAVTNYAVGDPILVGTGSTAEWRTITAVGTAGAGGTGITIDSGLAFAHALGQPVLEASEDLVYATSPATPTSGWLTDATASGGTISYSLPGGALTGAAATYRYAIEVLDSDGLYAILT